MGKKKKNSAKKSGNRFFRWIRSDLPDDEDKKSPVLLLGINKIESPFVRRRRSTDGAQTSGSIRFFRPPKSKYTRGHHGDDRLEKIRKDLLTHQHGTDQYIPNDKNISVHEEKLSDVCIKLNCAGNCACKRENSSNRGSFSFHRPENRQSSLCPSEPYGVEARATDYSEDEIEFKYTEHSLDKPSSSKQSSYNVTPKSTERRSLLLANLNERFRKTLSLDSRKIETSRVPLSLPQESRPKSLVNTSNLCVQPADPFVNSNFSKASQPKKKRKSFFSLDTFFDKKSDTSSVDDYCSSKYKRFELESDDSPLFRNAREKTPDLLKLPVIIDSVRKRNSETKRQLEKLENHFYKSLNKDRVSKTVIDAIPKDATDIQGPSGHTNHLYDDDEVEYIEPIRSNFTSQSTLILEKNIPQELLKPDSILTINTSETDIRLPSSTVSPKSNGRLDLDSIGAYEIEVKEADLLNDRPKNLTVKIMDKSVDSIGSCSLDVDASTDFSDTTSGSLNLLTPTSTTSRIRDFTSKIQERASNPKHSVSHPLPPQKYDHHLKPPPPNVTLNDTASHRSRGHHKKRDELPHKKPSYLNLACSVNGYTNLTTYDSKLRQDINKSREASPIRPITHTYQYKTENNSLLVPVPISANKLLVPTFGPHDTRSDLTSTSPSKELTDPYYSTSPLHVYMATENKQLKNDFLGASMITTTSRPYMSSESKTFATSMLNQTDQVDNVKEIKSSYSESNFRNGTDVRIARNSESYTIGTEESEETKTRNFSSESYTISANGLSKRVEITKENGEQLTSPMKSFIQQRVERLYGPGALAQGFFNQKRYKSNSQSENDMLHRTSSHGVSRTSFESTHQEVDYSSPSEAEANLSLPVLRHLRPEFRAQLPILSPKKSPKAEVPQKTDIPISIEKTDLIPNSNTRKDDVAIATTSAKDASIVNGVSALKLVNSSSDVLKDPVNGVPVVETNGGSKSEGVKDGHYFLELEMKETQRLLALSASAEKELLQLQDQNVSEEVLGFLRSAAGKARLLATQKMQQFQGLCYNNINERANDPYPTTTEDLQGFWDMVCLQVDNVNALFRHMDELKANNWEEIAAPVKKVILPSQSATRSPRAPATVSCAASPAPRTLPVKAKLAAEKREADRKVMLEHRRRVARERQLAAKSAKSLPGTSHEELSEMSIEGAHEVEIFVGRGARPSLVAPKGDCRSTVESDTSLTHNS